MAKPTETGGCKHIVVITMDECKANVLGCYGNRYAETPGIDKLAKDSVLFEQCFTVMPKCVPARAALFTGRYCHTDGHRTLPNFEIRKNEDNIVRAFKDAGYATGLFGKNHTFMPDAMDVNLDRYKPGHEGKDVPQQRSERETDDDLFRAFYRGDFSCTEEMADTIATKRFAEFATEQKDKPFFAILNYNAPHPPYSDNAAYIQKIRDKRIPLPPIEPLDSCPRVLRACREVYGLEHLDESKWRLVVEAYYNMAAYVSDQIDAAVAVLKKLGIYDEALIILASDHGDFAGEHGAVEKWDTLFYDCLIHIPLLLKLPHFRMAGERRSTLCEIIDLAPTICQIAGMPVSDYFHGKSLMDAVADPSFVHREEVFCEGGVEPQALARSLHYDTPEHRKRHPNYLWKQKIMVDFPYSMIRAKMIRTREWKLTFRVDGEIELYNLIQDPGEFENLSGRPEAASISQDLIRRLLQWSIRTEPDTPRIEVMYS